MARITPVKLPSSSKTLWFDANGVDAAKGDAVIVQTARGSEYGTVSEPPFDATPEQLSSLKSALKPVVRLATEQDAQHLAELQQRARDIMPAYRELVEEEGLDIRPVSVEFMFDGDKAVFYFESEDRVDFRELVRKLASRFKVRVDMRQIGPRDEARMVGGIGHCGQELCCKRLGGEFCPVSIRMAKEQDLSLNPLKISGICGRLMCCLRYEYDAYKDFKGRAPKVGAKIETPDGVGKVISLDVPKEMVTIQVDADKKISVPLSDMTKSAHDAARPDAVDEEAWERASNKEEMTVFGEASFVTSQFTSTDKLGEAKAIHRETSGGKKEKRERRGKDASSGRSGRSGRRDRNECERNKDAAERTVPARKPRRRSTKLSGGDSSELTVETTQIKSSAGKSAQDSGAKNAASREDAQSSRGRTRSRRNKGQASATVQDGRQASSRAKGVDTANAHAGAKASAPAKEQSRRAIAGDSKANAEAGSSERRRRRRSSKPAAGERPANGERAERNQQGAPQGHGRSEQREGQDNQTMRPGRRSSSLRQHADATSTEGSREHRNNTSGGNRNNAAGGAHDNGAANAGASANSDERRSNHRRPRRRKSSSGGASAGTSGSANTGNPSSNGSKNIQGGKAAHGANNDNNKGGAQ